MGCIIIKQQLPVKYILDIRGVFVSDFVAVVSRQSSVVSRCAGFGDKCVLCRRLRSRCFVGAADAGTFGA